MREKAPKAFTWPWLITAWSLPVLVGALVAFAYVRSLESKQASELLRLRTQVENTNRDYKNFRDKIRRASVTAGYKPYTPIEGENLDVETPTLEAGKQAPIIQHVYTSFGQMVLNGQAGGGGASEELSPQINAFANWVSSQPAGGFESSVKSMRGDIAYLGQLRQELLKQLAMKVYKQNYTVKSAFNPTTREEGIRIFADLHRQGETSTEGIFSATLEDQHQRYLRGETPGDPSLAARGVTNLTLEDIALMQRGLIDRLAEATNKQKILLYGEVDGWEIYDTAAKNLDSSYTSSVKSSFEQQSSTANSRVSADAGIEEGIKKAYEGSGSEIVLPTDTDREALVGIADDIDREIGAHEADANAFRNLLQSKKALAKLSTLHGYEVDGRVEWVDGENKLCHINLGTANKVRSGMRFEVHALNGNDIDRFKGVVEIVRPLSQYFSLCVILDTVENVEIEVGDSLINHLWKDGSYLKVALHGADWGGNSTYYDKFRFEEMLRSLGVTVEEKLGPGTNIVILGKGIEKDAYYLDVQDKIDVKRLNASEIRLYIDPR